MEDEGKIEHVAHVQFCAIAEYDTKIRIQIMYLNNLVWSKYLYHQQYSCRYMWMNHVSLYGDYPLLHLTSHRLTNSRPQSTLLNIIYKILNLRHSPTATTKMGSTFNRRKNNVTIMMFTCQIILKIILGKIFLSLPQIMIEVVLSKLFLGKN